MGWRRANDPTFKKRPVTKASTTTNQNTHLGKDGSPSRRFMMQCSEGRKEAARLTPLLTPRTSARLGTWNIRTMYETGKTIQVAREMKNYKIGVLVLSETRCLLQSGQLELSSGEQLLYPRIITAKFTTKKKDIRLNIIQCYAPTSDAEEEK